MATELVHCKACSCEVPRGHTVTYQNDLYCADCWVKKLKSISKNHQYSDGRYPGPLHIEEPPSAKNKS